MAYSGGASACAPNGPNVDFSSLLPASVTLVRRSASTSFSSSKEEGKKQINAATKEDGEEVHAILKKVDRTKGADEDMKRAMWHLLNHEIVEGGDSYPFEKALDFETFCDYYCSFDCFVLVLAEDNDHSINEDDNGNHKNNVLVVERSGQRYDFGNKLIGSVHIRPNFPGRSSCVANGAFLVVPLHRRLGAALVLGSYFPVFAKLLGYKTTLFNLVFEANIPSIRLWKKLGYPQVGRVENAGRLKRAATQEGEGDVMSAAIMFSIQLDDENVVKLSELFSRQVHLSRDILAKIGTKPFGSFLLLSNDVS